MVCIYCRSSTSVTNSRPQKRMNQVWRRRTCLSCGAVFSTLEQADLEKGWVVQYRDGSLKPFMRDKLLISIFKSCQHRPDALQDSMGLCATIIAGLLKPAPQNGVLKQNDIGKRAYAVLKRFDQPAATHYQAFHQDALR